MTPIDKLPFLKEVLPVATDDKTQRLRYVRDTVTASPKTVLEKRYDAFSAMVHNWLKRDEVIGTSTEEAICLVSYFHQERLEIPETHTPEAKKELEGKLKVALDYFEALMGNTFRLI